MDHGHGTGTMAMCVPGICNSDLVSQSNHESAYNHRHRLQTDFFP